MDKWRVLRGCTNKDGRYFKAGSVVKKGDFPMSVIRGWVEKEGNPVLELIVEVPDGSDTNLG